MGKKEFPISPQPLKQNRRKSREGRLFTPAETPNEIANRK